MLELALHEAEPGMTTLTDVCDRSGRILVGAGVCLDAKQLKLLKAWGIRTVRVVDDTTTDIDADAVEVDLSALEREAAEMFDPADLSHPLVQKLIPVVARQLGKGSGGGRG